MKNVRAKKKGWLKVLPGDLEAFIQGGAILGGGGGGWIEEGRRLGRLSLERGFLGLAPLSFFPGEALLLTVSAVGAPSAGSRLVEPEDYIRAVELLIEKTKLKISGLIPSEVGALGVVNGWVQSAALGIPVVDAPCNGRAHPLGLMGSMGLDREKEFISYQAVAAGRRKKEKCFEAFFSGPLEKVSASVLEAARAAGGMIAVARNPVPASYVEKNGSPGALEMAFRLGKRFLREGPPELRIKRVIHFLGGGYMTSGRVRKKRLEREGGLDVGQVELASGSRTFELAFWNEYMTLEEQGRRLATFPDLIMTFERETAHPLISAQLRTGQDVFLMAVPSRFLRLGAGVKNRRLLSRIEKAVGKKS
ncbi:MAG: DUF917 family protein [Clostridiales bacterium]|nr:DUF917 family protein [Clostridiales bacterium]